MDVKKIKVLVVDDSAFMRKMISNILESHHLLTVVGTARNGLDALKKIDVLNPDVITLDIEMPEMDGLTALKRIMETKPMPVVMLSSLSKHSADKTFESMELGAVDFVAKPSGAISLNIKEIESEIISKVLEATKVKVDLFTKANRTPEYSKASDHRITQNFLKKNQNIIGIGTSTGGPRALQQVITRLPENIPAPIVIVQHMPPGFTESLAKRLDQLSHVKVLEVSDGEKLENGVAYIAPGGYQFRVIETKEGLRAKITKEEPKSGHQPSVDVLFESLANLLNYNLIGTIMTGMGADGANGIVEMKKKKQNTVIIAEAEETCVVYGMPKSAVKTGVVDHVVQLPEIADMIINLLKIRGE